MRIERGTDHRIEHRKILEDRLLPRCEAALRVIAPEDAHKAEQMLEVLKQIKENGWIHSWSVEGAPTPRFKAGDVVWIGGIGDDEQLTPYLQAELPQTPLKLIEFLDHLFKDTDAMPAEFKKGYTTVKSANITVPERA